MLFIVLLVFANKLGEIIKAPIEQFYGYIITKETIFGVIHNL